MVNEIQSESVEQESSVKSFLDKYSALVKNITDIQYADQVDNIDGRMYFAINSHNIGNWIDLRGVMLLEDKESLLTANKTVGMVAMLEWALPFYLAGQFTQGEIGFSITPGNKETSISREVRDTNLRTLAKVSEHALENFFEQSSLRGIDFLQTGLEFQKDLDTLVKGGINPIQLIGDLRKKFDDVRLKSGEENDTVRSKLLGMPVKQ